jgi:di/tricarboxylate transporter
MSLDQGLAFAIIGGTMALLIWGRVRYDLVALTALLASLAVGIVPLKSAFSGFSDDIVIIVGSALVVSASISRSGIVESLIRPVARRLKHVSVQLPIMISAVTFLSAFVKNVGALAIFLPIALQIGKRTRTPPSRLLMPLSFGSLLGGLITLIGTSPNIIVSRVRDDLAGQPFEMFDFLPVGGSLSLIGVVFLSFAWRLLPGDRGSGSKQGPFEIGDYTTEASLPETSPLVGHTVRELEELGEEEVTVAAILREKQHLYVPAGHWTLYANDVLVLEGDADSLKKVVDSAQLKLVAETKTGAQPAQPNVSSAVEAVITERSVLIGTSAGEMRLRDRYGVILLAMRRRGHQVRQRLHHVRFQPGDLMVLQGRTEEMADTLASLGCLPLAERHLRLGRKRRVTVPVAILGIAMAMVALEIVPVTFAFFAAAVLILLSGALTLKEAYDSIEWPILILLGALIPVSEALRSTGATDLVAGWLSGIAMTLPPIGALTMMLVAAMAITPFLNNAATVLVMAPIGASLAQRLGLNIDPFLMAVAIGAGCDFLTPIGHQCNTLVMGPGGYRFGDYARLGLPLSLLVIVSAPLLITWVWPMH